MFVNDASTSARVNVTLRISQDDGQTWPEKLLISEQGGYADTVVMEWLWWRSAMAVVAFEKNTCSIDVATVGLAERNNSREV